MTFLVSVQAAVLPAAQSKRMTLVDCAPYYKDAMLGRFYAICNCCSCCCGAMEAQRNGTPMIASSGYVAQVDEDLCAACGTCAEYCQFAAISVDNEFARIDVAACMGCGVCVARCAQDAISLLRNPAKGIPLEIHALIDRAAK
jgi:heterodisulfide reductase subunit A-like polyferredoxin